MALDPTLSAGIVVALITALGAWAAQRSAAKASTINTNTQAKVEAEKGAYERARQFDTDTIERQNAMLEDLRKNNETLSEKLEAQSAKIDQVLEKNHELTQDNRQLKAEVKTLRTRIARLERGIPPDSEETIRERDDDEHPPLPE